MTWRVGLVFGVCNAFLTEFFPSQALGIPTLPPSLTQDLVDDPEFLTALHNVLMNVHIVRGMLTCPATGREFPVTNGIANMMLDEDECEHVRM